MTDISNYTNTPGLGVICARFQVAELHEGHKWFIEQVRARHSHVLIVLGTTVVKMSPVNPLTYEDRKEMLKQTFPDADWLLIDRVADHPSNEYWSKCLDGVVMNNVAYLSEKVGGRAVAGIMLYGSRNSFLPYYSGTFQSLEITAEQEFLSGTKHREDVCNNPPHTLDYRRGKIAACADRYPVNYMTVDGIIYNPSTDKFLLGKKKGSDTWQFVGGFTDPTDASLEEAIRREAGEEVRDWQYYDERTHYDKKYTGVPIKIDKIKYLGSLRINDSRFRAEPDKIMTAVFLCTHKDYAGQIYGGDDIETVSWFDITHLMTNRHIISEVHHPILDLLIKHLLKKPQEV